jgi:ATP-dependent phosphofructokinase / diphosphate-dependent phosphofructokinase
MVVEVMGRSAGHLALQAGIAGGADIILIPEINYSIREVCQHIDELRDRWKRKFALVMVAEGIHPATDPVSCGKESPPPTPEHTMGQYIADQIINCDDRLVEVRVSVLGHIQRGGIPTALDRLIAAAFGKVAVDLVAGGQSRQMVAWQNGRVAVVPTEEVVALSPLAVDPQSYLVETARALGIYVGS